MTNNEILIGTKKDNLLHEALEQHPSFLVQRCIFENIPLTIEEVDHYLGAKEVMGEEVDRIWLLKKLADASLLDAPHHLIKLILKQ